MDQNKEKITFMNFELDIKLDDLVSKIGSIEKEKNDKIYLLVKILESSTDGYWDWHIGSGVDGEEDYEFLSERFKQQLGYSNEDMEDKPSSWQSICNADDLASMLQKAQEHFDSQGEVDFMTECRYIHKNGSMIWILCRGSVVEWNEDGSPKRMVGTHTDITSLKI